MGDLKPAFIGIKRDHTDDHTWREEEVFSMRQILSYLVAAMILSVSSIAMVAALLARDVFGQGDPYVALVFVLLFILYFIFLLLLDRLQNVKKMVRG